jgi:hypothetical protein
MITELISYQSNEMVKPRSFFSHRQFHEFGGRYHLIYLIGIMMNEGDEIESNAVS